MYIFLTFTKKNVNIIEKDAMYTIYCEMKYINMNRELFIKVQVTITTNSIKVL